MERCTECNELAVERDQHYCQEQLVCKACGAIFSEGSYTNDSGFAATDSGIFSEKQTNTLPWKIQKEGCRTTPAGEKICLKKLDILFSAFSVPSFMKVEATGLLKMALKHPSFVRLHMEKKKALAACCICVIFRQNDWPITIASLCNLVQVELKVFNDVFRLLLTEFQITLTMTPIEELVTFYLKNANVESKEELTDKCIDIIELAREVWIVRGTKPNGVISAAVYMAWMAEQLDRQCKTTYKKFCQETKLSFEPSAPVRFKELLNMFTALAKELPWIQKEDLSKKEVLYSLDSVLKYSKSLIASTRNNSDESELENWDRYLSNKRQKTDKDPEPVASCDVPVSDSLELTEDDIPSSEMHKYLRSDDEIRRLKAMVAEND